MTPVEAAALIGCSVRHVRLLCKQRKIKTRRRKMQSGFYYVLDPTSVQAYANTKQSKGFPRGQKRSQ